MIKSNDRHASSGPSYPLLKLSPFAPPVFIELFKILNSLFWRAESCFLSFLGLHEMSQVLCRYSDKK